MGPESKPIVLGATSLLLPPTQEDFLRRLQGHCLSPSWLASLALAGEPPWWKHEPLGHPGGIGLALSAFLLKLLLLGHQFLQQLLLCGLNVMLGGPLLQELLLELLLLNCLLLLHLHLPPLQFHLQWSN